MGKTTTNPLLTGVSGRIGNLLIKQYKTGTVITLMPTYFKKTPAPKEKRHWETFAAAVKYAKEETTKQHLKYHNDDPEKYRDVYHPAIKTFMAAAKEAKWAGKFNPDGGPPKVNAEAVVEIIRRNEEAKEEVKPVKVKAVKKKIAVKKIGKKK